MRATAYIVLGLIVAMIVAPLVQQYHDVDVQICIVCLGFVGWGLLVGIAKGIMTEDTPTTSIKGTSKEVTSFSGNRIKADRYIPITAAPTNYIAPISGSLDLTTRSQCCEDFMSVNTFNELYQR